MIINNLNLLQQSKKRYFLRRKQNGKLQSIQKLTVG